LTPTEAPKSDHTVELAADDPWQTIDSCQPIRRKPNGRLAAHSEDDEADPPPKPLANDRLRLLPTICNRNRWAAMLPNDIRLAIHLDDEIVIDAPFLVQAGFWANHASKLRIGDTIEVYHDDPNFYWSLCFLAVKGIEKGVPEIVESLPYHPIVDVLPIMKGAQFDELVADIKATGKLREKIVLHEGMILEGRDRYRACVVAGLFKPSSGPKVHIKDTKHFVVLPANQDPIDFVLRRKGQRITESQRAFFAKLAMMRPASKPSPAVIAPAPNDGVLAPRPRDHVRPQARKPVDERMEDHDAAFAPYFPGDPEGDPWLTVRRTLNVVSLDARGGDMGIPPEVEDELAPDLGELIPESEDDEAEKPVPERREAIAQMMRVYRNVLDRQEQFVIDMRYNKDDPVPYATIAKACRPRISGRSQVRKIEQRALRKMAERLGKFRDLTPKPNKSAPKVEVDDED
jgi:hypothetical protein